MLGNVQPIAAHLRNLHAPAPLRDEPVWLVWRYEANPSDNLKPLKVPYYPLGNKRAGLQGSPKDRAGLTTFAVARDQAIKRAMDGVGVAMLEGGDIVALDFDNCVVDGRIPAEIEALIGATYCELSPSGRGVRALMRGNIGNRKSPTTDTQFGFEVFSTTGYVTVTGNMLPFVDVLGYEDTLRRVTPEVEEFCRKRFGSSAPAQRDSEDFTAGFEPKLGLAYDEMYDLLQQLDPDTGRDEWIRVGMALHHETSGEEDGFELWNEWSSYGGKYPGEDALRTQWDSFTRRVGPGRRQVTMASVKRMVKDAAPASPDDLREVAERAPSRASFDGLFPAIRGQDLVLSRANAWLIKGVLPASDTDPSLIFGASGSGKSFFVLDLACAVARGHDWRGCRTQQGRVLYIAAEGAAGMRKRLQAYCDAHAVDIDALPIDFITSAPNILETEHVQELVKTISTFGPYKLLIVDTLAQVTPGANENTSEDMGKALTNIKSLQQAVRCSTAIVHHAGKDLSRGSRGWSGIKGAMDAQLEIVRDEDTGARFMRVEKMKDGEDGAVYPFKLEIVQVGVDEDGDPITSCIVVEAEPQQRKEPERKNVKRRGRVETHILEVLTLIDAQTSAIKLGDLVSKATDLLPPPAEGERDTRRQHVTRAIQKLAKEPDGPISLDGGLVVLYE